MTISVLGISTSPRKNGNSDLLLQEALQAAEKAGAAAEYINLNNYNIKPCLECNNCYKAGVCVIKDDYHQLMDKLLKTDRLIFATPIYFMNVCAQAKILIDRAQSLWSKKHILKQELFDKSRDRRAMIIAVGGSKSQNQFTSIRWTLKTYFDTLDFKYTSALFVNQVDEFGAVKEHRLALREAYGLGSLFASNNPLPDSPVEVQLT